MAYLASIVVYLFFLAAVLAVPVFLAVVILRFLRAYETRTENRAEMARIQQRLSAIEEGMTDLQDQLHRVTEEHAFNTKLLSGRTRET